MAMAALPLGEAEIIRAQLDFDPSQPLRRQLSHLLETMLELRLVDGRRCILGWSPERSPGGAFRIVVEGDPPIWADDWNAARRALEQITCGPSRAEQPS